MRYDDEKRRNSLCLKDEGIEGGENSSTTLSTTARERRQRDWLYFESQVSGEYVTIMSTS